MEATAGNLPYADWDSLNEAAIQLRAYSSLIHTDNAARFLAGELKDVARLLRQTHDEAHKYEWFEDGG